MLSMHQSKQLLSSSDDIEHVNRHILPWFYAYFEWHFYCELLLIPSRQQQSK